MSPTLRFHLIELVVFALGVLALMLAVELGYRSGARHAADMDDPGRTVQTTIETAIVGVLALLLGFTFSMAMTRYETRRRLVIDESNAIGTAALRARMLPAPHATAAHALLLRYVDARIAFGRATGDSARQRALAMVTDRLQEHLWAHAAGAAALDSRSVPTGLFISALNDVIDLRAKRIFEIAAHVPKSIIRVLIFVALVSCALLGKICGLARRRQLVATTLVAMVVTAVTVLIIDLDRPEGGLIQVSQQCLIDLRASLAAPAP